MTSVSPPSVFQSTLPARGATPPSRGCRQSGLDFNPRSPHGERRLFSIVFVGISGISIHAPRTGSDALILLGLLVEVLFQSTLPARGATNSYGIINNCKRISIHAPRTGSDTARPKKWRAERYFNPRSPHGERRRTATHKRRRERFQSTLPARGATPRGGDERGGGMAFQSTLPARGATAFSIVFVGISAFQSTLPARGATGEAQAFTAWVLKFQSTLPARGATWP